MIEDYQFIPCRFVPYRALSQGIGVRGDVASRGFCGRECSAGSSCCCRCRYLYHCGEYRLLARCRFVGCRCIACPSLDGCPSFTIGRIAYRLSLFLGLSTLSPVHGEKERAVPLGISSIGTALDRWVKSVYGIAVLIAWLPMRTT